MSGKGAIGLCDVRGDVVACGFEEVVDVRVLMVVVVAVGMEDSPGGDWLAVGHGAETWRLPNSVRLSDVECISGASSTIDFESSNSGGIM